MLSSGPPKGWFVHNELDHAGNITMTVTKVLREEGEPRAELKDLKIVVKPSVPWWERLLGGDFKKRLATAVTKTQKRAYELNLQYKQAKSAAYELAQVTRKENPHDD